VNTEKINFFRVTFLMERMCPVDQTTGHGLGRVFNETYFAEYKDAIDYITVHHGKYALIDPHNYMRYNNPSQQPFSGSVIGNTSDPRAATTEDFGIFWNELALRFRDNPNVVFGINNEPNSMPTELVLQNDQSAVDGIRASGANQLILAPGNGFTGGHAWTQSSQGDQPSSEFMFLLRDPINNMAMDIHEYLDIDFSGSHDTCTQPGPSNLANLTAWLIEHNLKAVVSEFGGGANQNCIDFIGDMLTYLADNDVYIGWSAWAAGPLWFDNPACCGADTGNLEPGTVNELGGPNAYETVWIPGIRPFVQAAQKDLKRRGTSSLD